MEDMRRLPETAPEVYEMFKAGKAVVKRGTNPFSSVGADMCLEQSINRSKKSSSGVIGTTRRKLYVAQWELIYHEMLAISNLHRELTHVQSDNYELKVHHEFKISETEYIECKVKEMMQYT